MITFDRFELNNGLRVLVHTDSSTPMVAVNICYDVGARDEDPEMTGLAHYFEHLMFSGSVNAPNFDHELQLAGGDNNAFTTNDYTNYYETLPKKNWETALWLESDRMFQMNLDSNSLEVQRKVVIEEFKQRYLNQPYGDAWMQLRALAYEKHPYRWATIGKEIAHIEKVTLEDAKNFYRQFYSPNNAVLCVAGDVTLDEVKPLVEKWFSDIPSQEIHRPNRISEGIQTKGRKKVFQQEIPLNAFWWGFPMEKRTDRAFFTADLISDIIGRGEGALLHERLIGELGLVSEIHAYVSGDRDEGLFIISGKILDGVDPLVVEKEIWKILNGLKEDLLSEEHLIKAKNKFETAHVYGEISVLNKATNLCYAELLGSADLVNQEPQFYSAVDLDSIRKWASEHFVPEKNNQVVYEKLG